MTMAMTKALESGTRGVICASTGNTSASAAAYAARAGIPCTVIIPDGKIAGLRTNPSVKRVEVDEVRRPISAVRSMPSGADKPSVAATADGSDAPAEVVPYGITMVEAMATGTPVIATACGAVPEVVADGVTGFICHDIREMIDCVERVSALSRAACRRHADDQHARRDRRGAVGADPRRPVTADRGLHQPGGRRPKDDVERIRAGTRDARGGPWRGCHRDARRRGQRGDRTATVRVE